MGQAHALRECLHSALLEHPSCAATLRLLLALAERFDFEALVGHLQEPSHEPTH